MEPLSLTETKPWYASKGILGPIVAGLALVASLFGVTIDPATQAVIVDQGVALITALVTFGGLVVGIWGRVSAVKKIG